MIVVWTEFRKTDVSKMYWFEYARYKRLCRYVAYGLSLVAGFALLLGCQAEEPVTSFEIIIERSCIAHITPGSRSDQEIRSALDECETINRASLVRDEGMVDSKRLIDYKWDLSPSQHGSMSLINGVVSLISLEVERGLPLGELLQTLGRPKSLSVFSKVYESCFASITLDYPTKGISLGIIKTYDCSSTVSIDATTRVDTYWRYIPGSLEEVLRDTFLMTEDGIASNLAQRQEWHGYGELRISEP